MRHLEEAKIIGDPASVTNIRSLFGDIEFSVMGPSGAHESGPPVLFRLTCVIPNHYRANDATIEAAPLYVLVPDTDIDRIWPKCEYDDVRYGTATRGGEPITGALCIHKGTSGLYFCLTPAGEQIEGWGSLGI